MTALALSLGAAVGLVMGLTGAGGGILAVPLLVFGMQLTLAQAGPVGLVAVGISAAVGALAGLKTGIVRYRAAMLIAASGVVVAPLGLWLAHRLDTRLLGLAFAAILLWVAYASLRPQPHGDVQRNPGPAPQRCIRHAGSGRFMWTSACAAALAASGAVAGVLSGLLGVGGGFVMVPALQRYTDLDAKSVVATSLAVIALISMAGVLASLASGNVKLDVALPFALGSGAGMIVAARLSARLPAHTLKRAFALVCLVVAVAMVAKAG